MVQDGAKRSKTEQGGTGRGVAEQGGRDERRGRGRTHGEWVGRGGNIE